MPDSAKEGGVKFQEGDYVLVNGEIHRIDAVSDNGAITYRTDAPEQPRWIGRFEALARMQTGHWRQVEKLCRVPGPVKYDSPGKWANFPGGIPVVPMKMMPVWEHVA